MRRTGLLRRWVVVYAPVGVGKEPDISGLGTSAKAAGKGSPRHQEQRVGGERRNVRALSPKLELGELGLGDLEGLHHDARVLARELDADSHTVAVALVSGQCVPGLSFPVLRRQRPAVLHLAQAGLEFRRGALQGQVEERALVPEIRQARQARTLE